MRKLIFVLGAILVVISAWPNGKFCFHPDFFCNERSHDLLGFPENKDTSEYITKRLTKFKYKKYIGKPVSVLLNNIGFNHTDLHFVQMKPNFITFVSLRYSSYISLDIYIDNFVFLKQQLGDGEASNIWKFEDLLKEKVSKIRVRTRYGKSLKEFPKLPVLPVI